MDQIRLHNATLQRILIQRDDLPDDPERVLVFDPADFGFVKRFYAVIDALNAKYDELRASQRDIKHELNDLGLPVNSEELIQKSLDACIFIREQIDEVFGTGTSLMVFGNSMNLGVYEQFLTKVTPFINSERQKKMEQYTVPPRKKNVHRRRK